MLVKHIITPGMSNAARVAYCGSGMGRQRSYQIHEASCIRCLESEKAVCQRLVDHPNMKGSSAEGFQWTIDRINERLAELR